LAKNVSVATVPFASPWPFTDVRWIVEVPNAQMPIVYHLVSADLAVCACIWTLSQLPAGVAAFQDETSSRNGKPVANQGEVHDPLW
jgi:hypothetical protein